MPTSQHTLKLPRTHGYFWFPPAEQIGTIDADHALAKDRRAKRCRGRVILVELFKEHELAAGLLLLERPVTVLIIGSAPEGAKDRGQPGGIGNDRAIQVCTIEPGVLSNNRVPMTLKYS
jgi:hypothetical protein